MREARIANGRKIDRDIYQQALHAQSASNLSGVAHSLPKVIERIWDEARSIGEGTEYVNTHPVVGLFLHQMAHLNKSNADLLGDKWAEAAQLCNDLTGNFRADAGDITVIEVTSGFKILHNPSTTARGMGDGVDRYSDETGAAYNVGTPEFYELLRADVKENWATLVEAYFPEAAEVHVGEELDA
jgi:hypothetical protein